MFTDTNSRFWANCSDWTNDNNRCSKSMCWLIYYKHGCIHCFRNHGCFRGFYGASCMTPPFGMLLMNNANFSPNPSTFSCDAASGKYIYFPVGGQTPINTIGCS